MRVAVTELLGSIYRRLYMDPLMQPPLYIKMARLSSLLFAAMVVAVSLAAGTLFARVLVSFTSSLGCAYRTCRSELEESC